MDDFHRRLGRIMWNECGMSRSEAGLKKAIADIAPCGMSSTATSRSGNRRPVQSGIGQSGPGSRPAGTGRVDVQGRPRANESCGGHFREEYQTPEGEALRDDEQFAFVSAWEYTGDPSEANLHREDLKFENIELKQRSYK